MTDPTPAMEAITTPVTELVEQFLEMASGLDVEPPGSDSRQAGLMYELDTLVSDYLDQNQLSTDEFHHLEQQVLNTIAEDLINESEALNENDSLDLAQDELGNFDAESVFTALDLSLMETTIEAPSESFGIDAMDG